MHKPILLSNISLSFLNKDCFEDFSTTIQPGSRIAIIGSNGTGKSSLINIIRGTVQPSDGRIIIPENLSIGYVEQVINDYNELSGGQKLNKRLTEALALFPDLLLLDEPTNHLDLTNRKHLIRMLKKYQGTLIVVSHDKELLQNCTDKIWHIENNKIHEFSGLYDDYIRETRRKHAEIKKNLSALKREKKASHEKLMKEQKRAANSKSKGEKSILTKRWNAMTGNAKAMKAE